MPTNPIAAIPGGGGWMRDSSGMMVPVGGGVSAKELQQLPKEMREIALAANTLIRGNFSKDLWPDLSVAISIAPRHRPTWGFIASITAGSMAERGAASKKFLMGITNMIAPGLLEEDGGRGRRDIRKPKFSKDSKVAEEDNE